MFTTSSHQESGALSSPASIAGSSPEPRVFIKTWVHQGKDPDSESDPGLLHHQIRITWIIKKLGAKFCPKDTNYFLSKRWIQNPDHWNLIKP